MTKKQYETALITVHGFTLSLLKDLNKQTDSKKALESVTAGLQLLAQGIQSGRFDLLRWITNDDCL